MQEEKLIDLDQFESLITKEFQEFRTDWEEQSAASPAIYPATMTLEEWILDFSDWLGA